MSWRDTIKNDAAPAAEAPKSWRDTITEDTQTEDVKAVEPHEMMGGKLVNHAAPKPSTPDALLRGTAKAGSLGFADEATAAAGTLRDYLAAKAGLRGDIDAGQLPDVYRSWRGHVRDADERAQEAHPLAFGAGEALGGAAAAMVPGRAAALDKAVLSGSAQGAATGLGSSEADLTRGDVKRAALDTYLGSMVGGLAGAAGRAPEGMRAGAAESLKGTANARTIKALDPILSQQELLNNKGVANDLARELRDSGVVRFGSDVKGMAPRLEAVLKDKGARIGTIRNEADAAMAAAGVPNSAVDMGLLSSIGNAKVAGTQASNLGTQAAARAYSRNADALANIPNRSIDEAQREIKSLSDQISFNKPYPERSAAQQGRTDLRRDLVKQVDDAVGKWSSPERAAEHQRLKEQFGLFKEAEPILDKAVARQDRNRDFSLTDHLMGGMAAATGGGADGLKAAAVMGLNKMARERGNSALAVGADKAARLLELGELGRFGDALRGAALRGGDSVAATHALLMRNPEYRALVGEDGDGQ